MKMTNRAVIMLILGMAMGLPLAAAQPGTLPMPPGFTLDADPEKTLAAYPLGVIHKDAAFVHHGKANKELVLPNGKTGWLYDVGDQEWHRSYTLVFGDDGTVSDVLYYDHGRFSKHGLSALQIQSVEPRTKGPALAPGPQ